MLRYALMSALLVILALEVWGYFAAVKRPMTVTSRSHFITADITTEVLKGLATLYLWSHSHSVYRTPAAVILVCIYLGLAIHDTHRMSTHRVIGQTKKSAVAWTTIDIVQAALIIVLVFA